MSEFIVTPQQLEDQITRTKERGLTWDRAFILLLGPSATGKSTIIQELNTQAGSGVFEYVKPIITRPNRPGETDKVSVSDAVFDQMEMQGEFVVVNALYGVRYGTPLSGIAKPLQEGKTPILDFPLDRVSIIERPEYDLIKVYVLPPSTEEWVGRIEASGRNTGDRLSSGLRELGSLAMAGTMRQDIDISVVNTNGAADQAASTILYALDRVLGLRDVMPTLQGQADHR